MSIIRFTSDYKGELSADKQYRAENVADFPQQAAHKLVKEIGVAVFDHAAQTNAPAPWPADNHPWLAGYVKPEPVIAPKVTTRPKVEDV